jgi:DNA-binding response OmpR family regulator
MRILVAEDDAPLAEFLHQRLLQEKFAVQMVASGPEAQRYTSDQSYDLVVLDLDRNGGRVHQLFGARWMWVLSWRLFGLFAGWGIRLGRMLRRCD